MSYFQQAKIVIVDFTGLERDALHIYVGLFVFVACCVLFRLKARDFRPWIVTLLVASAGEILDLRDALTYDHPLLFAEGIKDFCNTIAVPTLLLLTTRMTGIFARPDHAA